VVENPTNVAIIEKNFTHQKVRLFQKKWRGLVPLKVKKNDGFHLALR